MTRLEIEPYIRTDGEYSTIELPAGPYIKRMYLENFKHAIEFMTPHFKGNGS